MENQAKEDAGMIAMQEMANLNQEPMEEEKSREVEIIMADESSSMASIEKSTAKQ